MKGIFCLSLLLGLCSCSVYMAANKKGVDIAEVSSCRTRACIQAKGAILVSSSEGHNGELIETYNVRKPTGSTGRAVMHGVLDLATLGVWEVAGTPIEGAQNQEEFVALKVVSNKQSGEVSKIELAQ